MVELSPRRAAAKGPLHRAFRRLPPLLLLALAAVLLPVTAAGAGTPRLLIDLNPAPVPNLGSEPRPLGELADGRAVFAAAGPTGGLEPFVTDGTAAGTRPLGDLCPGECGSAPAAAAASTGGHVVFRAAGAAGGTGALWATDGTPAGTRRVVDGLYPDYDFELLGTPGRAFLLARDETQRPGLWVTDGTPAGTRRLPHLGVPGYVPGAFGGVLGERVLFVAASGVGGTQEVWSTDGTAGGTQRLIGSSQPGRAFTGRGSVAYRFAALGSGEGVIVEQAEEPGEVPRLELWTTDGTPGGTARVAGIEDAALVLLDAAGEGWAGLLVLRRDGAYALWRTDGSAGGTGLLATFTDQPATGATAAGGRLFYPLYRLGEPGWRLLATDGSSGGTVELGRVCAAGCNVGSRVVPLRDGVAFVAGSAGFQQLWLSDGTHGGTAAAATLCEGGDCSHQTLIAGVFAPHGVDELFLQVVRDPGLTWSLVASDGTAGGTRTLAGPGLPYPLPNVAFLAVAGGVVFAADDGVHGREPWVTDGTAAGTGLLADLAPAGGSGDASPTGLTRRGDRLLFFARGAAGWGLYESDGTAAGTRRLHDLANSVFIDAFSGAGPRALTLVGDRFFFLQPAPPDARWADLKVAELDRGILRHLGRFPFTLGAVPPVATAGGLLLWGADGRLGVSDGTLEGSRLLAGGYRLDWGEASLATFDAATALVSGLRLDAGGEVVERGVWRSDGTPGGTVLLHRLAADVVEPPPLAAAGGEGFFGVLYRVGSGFEGELWTTDGTPAGTRAVRRFVEERPPHLVYGPGELTISGGRLFFTVSRGTEELWVSDGSDLGTERLPLQPVAGSPSADVQDAVPFRGGLLFALYQTWTGAEPWWSDGTPAGARPLGDLLPGHDGSYPRGFTVDGDAAFFAAESLPGFPPRIWTTDGTAAGTFVADGGPPPRQPPDPDFPRPRYEPEMIAVGSRLIYTARTPAAGDELWVLPTTGIEPPPPGPPQTPPAAPRGLVVHTGSDGDLFLTWVDPAAEELYFEVESRTPASGRFETVARSSFPSALLQSLPLGLPHTLRVRTVNAAGASPPSSEVSAVPRDGTAAGCETGGEVLCLGGRFRAAVHWRNPRTGGHGTGRAMTLPGSDRSGAFWFFDDDNVELIVKALDGTPVNRRYWVFTGGLTDVEYWLHVVDTETLDAPPPSPGTGERVYHHPPGDLCGFADADAFPGVAAAAARVAAAGGAAGTALELAGGRFRAEVEWRNQRTGNGGHGVAVPGTDDSGYFWFFDPVNLELVVKVLDGRPVNGYWWVFWGGLTDLEVTLRVTDTQAAGEGAVRTYRKAPGDLCGGADTTAF